MDANVFRNFSAIRPELLRIGAPNVPMLTTPMLRIPSAMPGFTEFCNLDVEEADYVLAAFDDSDWLPAVEGRVLQASHLLPRPIPLFRETERKPLRITRKNGETLADFGEMVFGRLEIAGHKSANAEITIEYIEDLKSGWAHAEGRRAMYADRLTGHVTDFHWKSFNKRGFRYIAVCGNLESVPSIRLLEYAYPLQENGTFLCSDSALNNLWKISERTLRICMDDLFNDCPHRDRRNGWMPSSPQKQHFLFSASPT